MINDDEDNDGMYEGAGGLKVFILLFLFEVMSHLYKYLVLIKYYCLLVIITIGLYH